MYEIHISPYGLAKYFVYIFFFSVLLVEENKEELHRIFPFIFLINALLDQKLIFLGMLCLSLTRKLVRFLSRSYIEMQSLKAGPLSLRS